MGDAEDACISTTMVDKDDMVRHTIWSSHDTTSMPSQLVEKKASRLPDRFSVNVESTRLGWFLHVGTESMTCTTCRCLGFLNLFDWGPGSRQNRPLRDAVRDFCTSGLGCAVGDRLGDKKNVVIWMKDVEDLRPKKLITCQCTPYHDMRELAHGR